MGPPCDSESCKKSSMRECQSIDEDTRKGILNYFWEKLNWDQKKMYIVSLVTKSEKKMKPKRNQESNQEEILPMHTKLKKQMERVCQYAKRCF